MDWNNLQIARTPRVEMNLRSQEEIIEIANEAAERESKLLLDISEVSTTYSINASGKYVPKKTDVWLQKGVEYNVFVLADKEDWRYITLKSKRSLLLGRGVIIREYETANYLLITPRGTYQIIGDEFYTEKQVADIVSVTPVNSQEVDKLIAQYDKALADYLGLEDPEQPKVKKVKPPKKVAEPKVHKVVAPPPLPEALVEIEEEEVEQELDARLFGK